MGRSERECGPPTLPDFGAPTGWTAASSAPQFTTVAGAANNILQDSAYALLPGTAVFNEQARSAAPIFSTVAGVAQMIIIAPAPALQHRARAEPEPKHDAEPAPTATRRRPALTAQFFWCVFPAVGSPRTAFFRRRRQHGPHRIRLPATCSSVGRFYSIR